MGVAQRRQGAVDDDIAAVKSCQSRQVRKGFLGLLNGGAAAYGLREGLDFGAEGGLYELLVALELGR